MDHLARAQRILELQEAENARVSIVFIHIGTESAPIPAVFSVFRTNETPSPGGFFSPLAHKQSVQIV